MAYTHLEMIAGIKPGTQSMVPVQKGATVKRLKCLAIAISMAMMAVAAFGSASALGSTVLCSTTGFPCPKEHRYPAGTSFGGGVYTGVLPETSFTIMATKGGFAGPTCGYALLGATTTQESGSPLPAKMEGGTSGYINANTCYWWKKSDTCSKASVSHPPVTFSDDTGPKMTFGTASEHLSFTFTCQEEGESWECKWGTAGALFNYYPTTGHLVAKEVPLTTESGGFICGTTAKLDATLWVGGEIYISSF